MYYIQYILVNNCIIHLYSDTSIANEYTHNFTKVESIYQLYTLNLILKIYLLARYYTSNYVTNHQDELSSLETLYYIKST